MSISNVPAENRLLSSRSAQFKSTPVDGSTSSSGQMNKFKIKVARIETTGRDERERQVCVTFQLDRRPISFQVPVLLSFKDFDDTEMVQAARNALHRIFAELASQSRKWKLTANDLKQLSDLSMRQNHDPPGLVKPDGDDLF